MGKSWVAAVLCAGFVVVAAGCAGSREHKEHMQPMLSGILDGKTFVGEVGQESKPSMGDTLTFKDGYFHSAACDQFHFRSGVYLAVASGDTTTFQAITHNPHGAVNVWTGTVKGDKLEGTATLYVKGQEPVKRWVKATLQ
jgi:hypothetical protein